MNTLSIGLLGGLLLAATALPAEERPVLSVVTAEPVITGDATASGRVVPQFRVMIGSRLAAHITDWGRNAAGQPLDVGMPVKAGEKLYAIAQGTFAAKVDSAQAALASARAALANLQAPTRPERITVLQAAVTELGARIKDRERDEQRFRQLVEVDKTAPAKRLEEVQLDLALLRSQYAAAQARLAEAVAGPTATEVALAEARVKEAESALATAQLDLHDTLIVAPFDAVITRRLKGLGDYVAGAPFVEVLELTTADQLEAELTLPEQCLPQLVAGTTRVAVSSPLLKQSLSLVVSRVIPTVETQHGTFAFRAVIPPADRGGLVPGAFVTGRLELPALTGGVVLPQRALRREGTQDYVLLAVDGKFARREVQVGDRLTEGVMIRAGLVPGDRVIVGLAAEARDGAPLPDYLRPATK